MIVGGSEVQSLENRNENLRYSRIKIGIRDKKITVGKEERGLSAIFDIKSVNLEFGVLKDFAALRFS